MGIKTETSRQWRPDNCIERALLPSHQARVWKSREGRADAFKAGLKKGRLKTQGRKVGGAKPGEQKKRRKKIQYLCKR